MANQLVLQVPRQHDTLCTSSKGLVDQPNLVPLLTPMALDHLFQSLYDKVDVPQLPQTPFSITQVITYRGLYAKEVQGSHKNLHRNS